MPAVESMPEAFRPVTPQEVFIGSDAAATKAFYTRLENCGTIGIVALNLFRAQKCSSRAKVYHGGIPGKGSFARMAYERKAWSLENLCRVLMTHWRELRISWGWRRDPREKFHPWVMYVDLPQGQVSFHNTKRLTGPDYYSDWDGKHQSEERILDFCTEVLRTQNRSPKFF